MREASSEMVSRAAPDGYTLLVIGAFFGTNPAFHKLPFDPVNSFAPIAKLGSGTMVLVVHPSVPANSVKEFIAFAKQKPGQLIWATSGVGSSQHLAAELFKVKTGINVKIVQFSGGGTAAINLLGGHSHATVSSLAQMLSHIKSGKLRALGVVADRRSASLPEVPTFAESGVPGYDVSGWWGILAPAGTPSPIVDRLNKEIKTILVSEELKKFFQAEGAEADYQGPAEFGAFISADINKWLRLVKEANIKVE